MSDLFEQEIIDDQFDDLEHKKRHPYVEPQVKDAQTIEMETQTIDNEFSKLKQEFDKANNAVTEQKLQDDVINLIDNILDEDDPFKNIDADDFWMEDGLFDNDNGQGIKEISKEIIDVNEPFIDDFESPIEKIRLDGDIDIPSDDGISETVDYNNDNNIVDLDDVSPVDYNNDNNLEDLDNIDLKKTSGKQITAKKTIKKYRNLTSKRPYQKIPKKLTMMLSF